MTSFVATEVSNLVKGLDNWTSPSFHPESTEVDGDDFFIVTVELCGGLEQLTRAKTKEIQLRFTRQKAGNAQACTTSRTDQPLVTSSTRKSNETGIEQSCSEGPGEARPAGRNATSCKEELGFPGSRARGRGDEDEAEKSVPLYQLIGFVSSFILSERPDMFADPYDGAPIDAAPAGVQLRHGDEENGKTTYPIEYILPGGVSPPMQLRPGVLALINDVDTEVLGGMEAPVHSSDCVTFISTLHGG